MDKVRPIIISLALVAFAGFFIWAIFSPKNNLQDIIANKLISEKDKLDVQFKYVTFSEISDGAKYWELNAISSTTNKTTGITYLKTVDGSFFTDGKPALKFLAPRAIWNMDKKEISLIEPLGYDNKFEKDIKTEVKRLGGLKKFFSYFYLSAETPRSNSKGYWFKSKVLNWKLSTKKLYCQGGIILTKGDTTLTSNSLEADVGLEKVLLTGSPNAVIVSEADSSKINIKATSFLVDSQTDYIYANDSVSIKNESAIVSSNNAVYNQKENIMNLSENVYVSTKNITAWSDKAEYSTLNYIVELSGNARAKRGDNELGGEKIIVLTKENKLFILGKSKAKIQGSEIEKLK